MIRNIPKALLLMTLLFSASCNKKPTTLFETKEVDYLNDTKNNLKGELLNISPMGLDNIIVYDSLLLATVQNPDGQLKVYSLATDREIASLCRQGRASNEMMNVIDLYGQRYVRNGHLIVPIIDNFQIIKEIDVTESLAQQKTVVLSSMSSQHVAFGSTVLLNKDPKQRFQITDANYDQKIREKLKPMKYEIVDQDSSIKEIKLFKNMMTSEEEVYDALNAYMNFATIHPSKNYVIQLFCWMDYILFLDVDNKKYFAIHQKGTRTFTDNARHIGDDEISKFGDVAFYDKGFFVLYNDGNNPFKEDGNKCPDILQFDLNGNYVQGFHLENTIHRIEYDQKEKRIIGAYLTEELLYSYDLSKYM